MDPSYFLRQYGSATGMESRIAGRPSYPPRQTSSSPFPQRHDSPLTASAQSPLPSPAGVSRTSINTPSPNSFVGVSSITPAMSQLLTARFGSLNPERMRQVLDILRQGSPTISATQSTPPQPMSTANHVFTSPPTYARNISHGNASPGSNRSSLNVYSTNAANATRRLDTQSVLPLNRAVNTPSIYGHNLPSGKGSQGTMFPPLNLYSTETGTPLANTSLGAAVKYAAVQTSGSINSFDTSSMPTPATNASVQNVYTKNTGLPLMSSGPGAAVASVQTPQSINSFRTSSTPTPATKIWEDGEKVQIVHTSEPSSTLLLTKFKTGSFIYNGRNRSCCPIEKCAVPRQSGKIQHIWRCAKKNCRFCAATAGENGTTDLTMAVAKSHRLHSVKTKIGWRDRQPIQQMEVMQPPQSFFGQSPGLAAARQRAIALLSEREMQTVRAQAATDLDQYLEGTEIAEDPAAALADEFLAGSNVCLGGDATAKSYVMDLTAAESVSNPPEPGSLESSATADEEAPFGDIPAIESATAMNNLTAPSRQGPGIVGETAQDAPGAQSETERVGIADPAHSAISPPDIEVGEQPGSSIEAEADAAESEDGNDDDEEELRAAFAQPCLNMRGYTEEDVAEWTKLLGVELKL